MTQLKLYKRLLGAPPCLTNMKNSSIFSNISLLLSLSGRAYKEQHTCRIAEYAWVTHTHECLCYVRTKHLSLYFQEKKHLNAHELMKRTQRVEIPRT